MQRFAEHEANDGAAPFGAIGAAVASLLALTGLVVAWSTDFAGCLDDETCDDRTLLRAQLVLAIVNAVMAAILVAAVLRKHGRSRLVAAVLFTIGFLTWALLNDAATHGWDDLRLWP